MSVISNFKKRQEIKAQKEKTSVERSLAGKEDIAPENQALMLLAKLLNVTEENAIAEATKYVESNIQYFGVDHASGEDKSVTVDVKIDDNGNVTTITETTDTDIDEFEAVKGELVAEIENSADAVQSAASNVESSADSVESSAQSVESSAQSVENSASDLAYTADDINAATDELKEVAAEIKKPSAAQKSSSSKKANEPKNS